ncbi:MAG: hypothetical protein U0L18_07875 [Acutalibacteraceae bacterium]|nr:hypothetical protein [Acutalibacteraceae bacterium]
MVKLNINSSKLYEGSLQAAITHAVAVGMYPELNYEHSWDGINYCMNNSEGCRATITFDSKYIVAVFQDIHKMDVNADAMTYFEGADEDIIELAKNEALQYVLENVNGEVKPVITAAFWGTWEQLYSAQSFDTIMNNGGYIIRTHLNSYKVATKEWKEYYDLNTRQIKLVHTLFDRKIKAGNKKVLLKSGDIKFLYGDTEECFTSLEELNIVNEND